ncbi:MAG: glycosyltransferase [Lachnospiraceae bacterium]|nr:glycosyltransferase [Lachnospiraceae bacterium]
MNLILLANAFPYGDWEPYLETEIKYYDCFDKVQICSLQVRKEQMNRIRELPSDKYHVFSVRKVSDLIYIFYSFFALADANFYMEMLEVLKMKRSILKRLIRLAVYVSRSHYEAGRILTYLRKTGLNADKDQGLIYSYRFEYQPYVGLLIQKKYPRFKVVSRAHGYDLYEERNAEAYIPMRRILLKKLDKVFMVSEDGRNYLRKKYPQFDKKILVQRLGTVGRKYIRARAPENQKISIVSCSNVIPLKRVGMIAGSLSRIKDIDVYWTHYGEGILSDEIKDFCRRNLPANIHYIFRGNVANQKILEEYSKGVYQLFINVSSAEGIPVSLMEAMSFGIPCVATDVGGTNEILKDGKEGILLNAECSSEDLAQVIRRFARMDAEEYRMFSENARMNWASRYNADKNYRTFAKCLIHEAGFGLPVNRAQAARFTGEDRI